jgi:hypothetical protein
MKTLRIVAGLCAAALIAAAPAPVPKDKCAGTQEIVSFDGAHLRLEVKDEKGEIQKIAVDETAVPGWKTYFRVGDKVTLTCSYPPEMGKPVITRIQKTEK